MSRQALPMLVVGQEPGTIVIQATRRGIEVRTDPPNMPAFAILGLVELARETVLRQAFRAADAAGKGGGGA